MKHIALGLSLAPSHSTTRGLGGIIKTTFQQDGRAVLPLPRSGLFGPPLAPPGKLLPGAVVAEHRRLLSGQATVQSSVLRQGSQVMHGFSDGR